MADKNAPAPRPAWDTEKGHKLILQHIKALLRADEKPPTEHEFEEFLYVCRKKNLDPLTSQIHFTRRKGALVPMVGIMAQRAKACATGEFAGIDAPVFTYAEDDRKKEKPVTASVTVYRFVQGQKCRFEGEAIFYREFVNEKSTNWREKPHAQLAKCAEAAAYKKAFAEELEGTMTAEEMFLEEYLEHQNETARPAAEKPQERRQKAAETGQQRAADTTNDAAGVVYQLNHRRTKEFKDEIKKHGWRWNPSARAWEVASTDKRIDDALNYARHLQCDIDDLEIQEKFEEPPSAAAEEIPF